MTHEMMAPPRPIRPPPGLADSSLNDASTPATHRSAPSPSSVDDGRWTTARAAARSLISSEETCAAAFSATLGGNAAMTLSAASRGSASSMAPASSAGIPPDAMIAPARSGGSDAAMAAADSWLMALSACAAAKGSICPTIAASLLAMPDESPDESPDASPAAAATDAWTASMASAAASGCIAEAAAAEAAGSMRTIIAARFSVGIRSSSAAPTVGSATPLARSAAAWGPSWESADAASEGSSAPNAEEAAAGSSLAIAASRDAAAPRAPLPPLPPLPPLAPLDPFEDPPESLASPAKPMASSSSAAAAQKPAPFAPPALAAAAAALAAPSGPSHDIRYAACFAVMRMIVKPWHVSGRSPKSLATAYPEPGTPRSVPAMATSTIAARCAAALSACRFVSVVMASAASLCPGSDSSSASNSGAPAFLGEIPMSTSTSLSSVSICTAAAAGPGTMLSTARMDHLVPRIRSTSLASSGVIALSKAPSCSGVIDSRMATRDSLGISTMHAMASWTSMLHIAAAATDGSIASAAAAAAVTSIDAITAPAAAGRMSPMACAATLEDMPANDRAARSEAALLGLSPPPPKANRLSASGSPAEPAAAAAAAAAASASNAPSPDSPPSPSAPPLDPVLDPDLDPTPLDPTPDLEVVPALPMASISSPCGSLTSTKNGHPGSVFPDRLTETECAPGSTQYTGDANRLLPFSNLTGLLNASPLGVCTVTTTASRPDISRIGFAGCTYRSVVWHRRGVSPATPRTVQSPDRNGASVGDRKYRLRESERPLTLTCKSCTAASSSATVTA